MTTKVVPGQLVATVSPEEAAREAASRMGRALRKSIEVSGAATLALSGGTTPRPAYELLAQERGIEWSKVDVFFVDERAVAPDSPRSNYRLVRESLFASGRAEGARIHRMPADEADLTAAAAAYDAELRSVVRAGPEGLPALDVILVGVGDDGHTASLFPNDPALDVTGALVTAVAAKGPREARLTLTTPAIEQARTLFVLATGGAKSAALERTWSVSGDIRETPARVLRGARGGVTWIIDRAAGGM